MEEDNFYEDLVNHDLNGKNIFSKVLIVLLMMLILGSGVYITLLKLKDDKEEEAKPEETKEVIEAIDLSCEDKCDYEVTIGDKNMKIDYEVTSEEEDSHHIIKWNDKKVIDEDFSCGGPALLHVLNDVIVISFHNGCTNGGNYVKVYSSDGNEIAKYDELDKFLKITSTNFVVIENKIKIPVSMLENDKIVIRNEEVELCDIDSWPDYSITNNTTVSGMFEIQYIGYNQMGLPLLTDEVKAVDAAKICDGE